MNTYLLFKSIHLISVISWMVGLLYLPRIFVYHSENIENENSSNIFKTMERKLFYYIMTPAMILSWIFGLLLIHILGFSIFSELWMQIKVISVVILTIYHLYLGSCVIRFVSSSVCFRCYITVYLVVVCFFKETVFRSVDDVACAGLLLWCFGQLQQPHNTWEAGTL